MTCIKIHDIIVSRHREVSKINKKSRAEYFKERRKSTKTFYAEIDTEKMDKLENILVNKQQTKKQWLIQKIDEEIGQKK